MGVLTVLLSIIIIAFTTIYVFFRRRYSFFEKEGVPYLKPTFPLGNVQGMGQKYHMIEVLMKLYDELKGKGGVVGIYNLAEPIYLITDVEVVKDILVKDFNTFVNRGSYINEKDEPLTASLLSVEDDRWRFLRNKLSPAFTSGKLKSMYFTVSNLGNNLISAIERKTKINKGIEVKNVMTRFTVDVVSSVSFGMESDTLNDKHPELIEYLRELFGLDSPNILYFLFLFAFPDVAKFLKLKFFSKRITEYFTSVICGNIKSREDRNESRNDLLNMLIQLKNKGSIDGEISTEVKKLSLNDCLAQAFIFFFGGSDTSSTTISYALTELAYNPDIQDKLRQEIIEKTKDTNGEITYEALHEMTYLNQVINETLRLHTPGFALFRKASEDYKVANSNIIIRKDVKVWIPTLAFHYDEKFWKNPLKFDPTRFTQEEIAKRHNFAYFPFGEGPRNCIGMRFGLVNAKYGVAMTIKNFKVSPDARMKYPIEYQFSRASVTFSSEMGILVIIFSAVLLIVTAIYLYFKKNYAFFEKEGIPYLKPTFPFGNVQGIGSKYHISTIMTNIYHEVKDMGGIVGFFNFAEPSYFMTDIELVKLITVKNFNSFVNRGLFVNEEYEPLSAHLVNIEDDRWRFMRNKLSPAFTSGKLRSMYTIISGLGDNLIKAAEKRAGKGFEVKNLMTKFTVDIVSSTSFGMESRCLNDENLELYEISREVFGAEGVGALKLFIMFAFPELSKFLRLRQFSKKVTNFFINVLSENIKYREENNDDRKDFMNMLIQLKSKGSIDGEFSSETRKLTLNEVLAQAFLFFFAGTDTSSTVSSFALTELAFNQDVQERLRNEILSMTKDTKGEVSYETLHEMTYLNQVVNETLRMYTPGSATLRQASEDFKVPNTNITIKKGYKVWMPTLAFQFEEKYWKNPNKFDPERFTPEEIAKRPPMAYSPFGEGPRNCIGMRFGLMNVKFALVTIIKNFKVIPDARMKYPFELNPVSTQMEPKGGFWLKFQKI
ncbi:cytochrome P450 6a2-like [Chironomus tepperi]|uniref:cytochrome P450 6a2-like n=1 Tax=Chironomus tepperi TaxID=113505 RepID=UPI00391F6CAD